MLLDVPFLLMKCGDVHDGHLVFTIHMNSYIRDNIQLFKRRLNLYHLSSSVFHDDILPL